jgi:hypothetical protein
MVAGVTVGLMRVGDAIETGVKEADAAGEQETMIIAQASRMTIYFLI